MFNFFGKHLGKLALMTAAALWASCSDAKEEKADKVVSENSSASQTDEFRSAIKEISKKSEHEIPSVPRNGHGGCDCSLRMHKLR